MSFMAATEKACLFSEDHLWEESGILLLNGARAYLSLSGLSGGGGGGYVIILSNALIIQPPLSSQNDTVR